MMIARFFLLALLLSAGSIQAGPDHSDLIGIGPHQTLRLNVMAQADQASGSCQVLLGFLDRDGQWVGGPQGSKFSKRVTLEPGQATHLEIQGRDVSADKRVKLVPAVQVQPDNHAENQCPGVIASVEVFDRKTGPNLVSLGDPALY